MSKNRFENIMDAFFTDNIDSKDAEKIISYLEKLKKEKVRLQSELVSIEAAKQIKNDAEERWQVLPEEKAAMDAFLKSKGL